MGRSRFESQSALCAPSRNSLLTSRRPDTLHLYDFYSYWRDVAGNFTTLPQYFKQHGYHTMSVGKVFHPAHNIHFPKSLRCTLNEMLCSGVSSNWSDDQPYSWSQYPYHPSTQKYKESAVCSNSDGTLGKNIVCPVEVHFQPGKTLPDLQSLHVAMKFLKERQGSHQPFLLAVGFHKPHVPLKYPRKYLKHHPLDSVQLPDVRQRPSALPTVAWNPWTDLRERDDIAALNLSFPFQPIPGNIHCHLSSPNTQPYTLVQSNIDLSIL
uniref:Sulfatase N-terminal domain-containing protein n=1 Tax=Timema tahoe TaxID=61484 RepID=A0A7R9IRW7_9NEOP|nr:unnamed protein product [Timema tahoe]